MAFSKDKVALFYTLPLSANDWTNLAISKVHRVMLVAAFADGPTLKRLVSMGVKAAVRINEGEYDTPDKRKAWVDRINFMALNGVDTAIIGCEPDNPFNLKWGSPNWGNQDAWKHAKSVDALRMGLASTGVRVVSPGFTCSPERISEDGLAEPGRVMFLEESRYVYDACHFNGFHLYCLGWQSVVDIHRVKWLLKQGMDEHHRALWIDELGVLIADDITKIRCYTEIADMLLQPPYRDRVENLTIFCANGTPGGAWDARFLLRDKKAYEALGAWVTT